jgi:hypothetical protein
MIENCSILCSNLLPTIHYKIVVIHSLGELLWALSIRVRMLLKFIRIMFIIAPEKVKASDIKKKAWLCVIRKEKMLGGPYWCVNVLFSIFYRTICRNVYSGRAPPGPLTMTCSDKTWVWVPTYNQIHDQQHSSACVLNMKTAYQPSHSQHIHHLPFSASFSVSISFEAIRTNYRLKFVSIFRHTTLQIT